MKQIVLIESIPNLNFPNFTENFATDLKYLVLKLKSMKGNDFDSLNDLGFTLVYYAIEICYEFQINGEGFLPENIKDGIINQVIKASDMVFITDDSFKEIIKSKFNSVIKNPIIVQESINFLDRIRNGK